MTHTLWSPSSLHRRVLCPGSANAERDMTETVDRESAEGTARHWVREAALLNEKQVDEFVGEVLEFDGFKFAVEQEWARSIQPGIDHLRELGGTMWVETEIDLSRWMPGEKGTLDSAVLANGILWICDFKSGRDPVSAVENLQLIAYFLGLWEQLTEEQRESIEKVILLIDQPYTDGVDTQWEAAPAELLAYGEVLRAAWLAGQDPRAPRLPHPKACRHCLAGPVCRERAQVLIDLFNITEEGEAVIPKAERLDEKTLAAILANARQITKALDQYKLRAVNELSGGNRVPGFKLVEGAGTREWRDEDEARAFLSERFPREKVFNSKLISPAQAENLLGTRLWAKAQKLIVRKDAAPLLVDESDKRPAVNVLDMFEPDDSDLDDLIGAPSAPADTGDLDDLI